MDVSRSIVRSALLALAGALACPSRHDAQCTAGTGSWSPIYDWESQMNVPFCGTGGASQETEFAHAALIPRGQLKGQVLLWRRERKSDTECGQGNTKRTWIFNPNNPGTLYEIEYEFPSDLFCAGQTWDLHGQLIVAGGNTAENSCSPSCPFPTETYRFRPQLFDKIQTVPPTPVQPWTRIGDMVIRRYYPTVTSLLRDPVYRSTDPEGLPPDEELLGGSILVAGGPTFEWPKDPCPPPNICIPSGSDGNDYWELMPPALGGAVTSWYPPFLPLGSAGQGPTVVDPYYGAGSWPYGSEKDTNPDWDKNSPHYNAFTPVNTTGSPAYDGYQRPTRAGTPPYADRLFDSYPRILQSSVNGEMVVCGDVDTGDPPANQPGTTWVIKPRTGTGGSQTNWESHVGPRGQDPDGSEGPDIWHDSHYDTSFILHDLQNGLEEFNRILMFGGSRDTGAGWVVNNQMWEFAPGGGPQGAIVGGTWVAKDSDPRFQRIYANAVILPTGEILIEGGEQTDTVHQGGASVPAYDPIIYDPGINQDATGTIYSGIAPADSHARLYHHVAALLLDGSVFIAGGRRPEDMNGTPVPNSASGTEPDPRFTGEIFLPPYLNFATTGRTRPIVETAPPSQVSFSDLFTTNQFQMQVDHSDDATIDSVVLLRPAAVTHHFDNDQRYIELYFSTTTVSAEPGRKLSTLNIDAPDESLGPPGYYMIFAIEAHGCTALGHRVPTQGRFIRIL